MAERRVTHVVRDRDGDILALCNPEEAWAQRRREWAIADILADRHEYFVEGLQGSHRRIYVVAGPSRPYLRTVPDSLGGNNLDTLPTLERNPWEVALEDAEILAVHAALIPVAPARVLLMGGDEHDKSNADEGDIHNTRVFHFASGAVSDSDSPPADVFCCGHAFLPDGRWLVGGGTLQWNDPETIDGELNPEGVEDQHVDAHGNPQNHWSGARDCAAYDPETGEWTATAPLQPEPGQAVRGGGRWYPTLITLADGRVLAVGGHPRVHGDDPSLNDGRHGAWLPEMYDAEADAWTYANGHWIYVTWGDVHPDEALPEGQVRPEGATSYLYYPRLFVLPDGRVFLASPNEGRCGWYDPATGLVDPLLLDPPPHQGRGYAETNHTAVLMPLLPTDGYTPHVLFLGYEGAHRLSLGEVDPEDPPTWQPAGQRDWPEGQVPLRRHGCATLLPTGEVLFTGGLDHDQTDGGSPDANGVLEAEIYSPGIRWDTGTYDFSQEAWVTTPPAHVVRNYHSVALLLPNGLVVTAGSNLNGSSGGDSVKEHRVEVYSPWYDGEPDRPTLLTAPATLTYGEDFQIVSSDASRIERVALMRCGTVTHAWDGDQRYVGLEFQLLAPGVLGATAPPSGGVAPPGPYLLWIIDRQGRPCHEARFLTLA